ncbi:5318_t:CDS:1, partial [Entrophospora sp. SA101]
QKLGKKLPVKLYLAAGKKLVSPDYDINSNEIENMSSILNLLNVRKLNDLQNLINELALPNPISVSEYIEIDDSH